MMRNLYTFIFLSNLVFQCNNFGYYADIYKTEKDMKIFSLLLIHWTFTILILTLLVSSFLWQKNKFISYLLTVSIISRNLLPFLDLEGRESRNTSSSNIFFLTIHNFVLSIIALFINFWYESKIFTLFINLACVCFMNYGGFRIFCPDDIT